MIRVGVHIYVCLWTKNIFESYFSDRLTLSNIRIKTSRRIYRLALPLLSPETLCSSSKSRIFLYNAHLALFVWIDDTITTQMHQYISLFSKLELALELVRATLAV